jgi:hypothetical protein
MFLRSRRAAAHGPAEVAVDGVKSEAAQRGTQTHAPASLRFAAVAKPPISGKREEPEPAASDQLWDDIDSLPTRAVGEARHALRHSRPPGPRARRPPARLTSPSVGTGIGTGLSGKGRFWK